MSEIPPLVWLVIIGAVLVLGSFVITPLDFSIGNAAFWLGVILIVIGVAVIVFAA
ncbi:MAG: hypothetical protein JRN52_09540 [Nitrososphaerota archaeon]|nr:hypothetical protein [Nitrososphaerota archaeon]